MYLLIRHDGNVYRAEPVAALSSDVMMRCDLPGNMQARCWANGQVDIIAPNYQGFGAWDVDHVTPGMADFFAEHVDGGLFSHPDSIDIDSDLLAEATADGFDLFNRDGDLPQWLVDKAVRVVAEWRQLHG